MKKNLCFLLVSLFLLSTFIANAQDTIHRVAGISGTIQSSQFGVMIPLWVSPTVSLAPAIDFQWGEKLGTDIGFGLVPKFYFSTKKLAPYVALRGGFLYYSPDKENDGETKTVDWVIGLAIGAEYFFDPQFSMGVEAQGNFTKSDENSLRFNNPGNWNFNLATMISANIYFLRKR